VACCRQEESGTSAAGTYGQGHRQRGEGEAWAALGSSRWTRENVSGEEDEDEAISVMDLLMGYSLGH
jgi:hypothetical protein